MKKLSILLLGAFVAVTVASCAKGYTCTETTTAGGTTVSEVTSYDKLTAKQKADLENFGTYSYTTPQGVLVTVKTECK